MTHQPLPGPIM